MNSLKLYGTASASANAIASVIIPSKARIRGVQWCAHITSQTDGSYAFIEISRASARETQTNGAQQCVSEVTIGVNFTTSGLSQNAVNLFAPVDVPVVQGQIIYLHAAISGTLTFRAECLIQYD